jgi:DNA primase
MNGNEISRRELTNEVVSYLGLIPKSKIFSNTSKMMFHCPFHKDNHPSLGIDLNKGVYNCFSCGRKGGVENLFYEATGESLYSHLGIKTNNDNFSLFSRKPQVITDRTEPNLSKKRVYLNYDSTSLIPALENKDCVEYLRRRGISLELAKSAGFLYAEDTSINGTRFRHRICIPVYENGTLQTIEGRRLSDDDSGPKVLYPKNTTVNTLYDIDNLDKSSTLYGVEGLMDLFVLRGCDVFNNSTSIFGANVTDRQLKLLSQFKKFIYIPDNDSAGESTIQKLKNSKNLNLGILKLPKKLENKDIKDVGDLPKIGLNVNFLVERKWLNYVKDY